MQDDILTYLEKAELHDHNYSMVISDLKTDFDVWKSNQVIYLIGMTMCATYACALSLFVSSHLWIILGTIGIMLLAIASMNLHYRTKQGKHNLHQQIVSIQTIAKKEA